MSKLTNGVIWGGAAMLIALACSDEDANDDVASRAGGAGAGAGGSSSGAGGKGSSGRGGSAGERAGDGGSAGRDPMPTGGAGANDGGTHAGGGQGAVGGVDEAGGGGAGGVMDCLVLEGQACSEPYIECNWQQDCCCGECYPSVACDCEADGWYCHYTDICLGMETCAGAGGGGAGGEGALGGAGSG